MGRGPLSRAPGGRGRGGGGGPSLTLLDERVGCQLPGAHVGVLLVGVLPVVVPLQGAGYVARVMAVGAAEGLQGKERG